jgi:hypothetical protein
VRGVLATLQRTFQNHFPVNQQSSTLPESLDGLIERVTFFNEENGYAITVHKSQGSEFPAVVIPLSTQHHLSLSRRKRKRVRTIHNAAGLCKCGIADCWNRAVDGMARSRVIGGIVSACASIICQHSLLTSPR